jgi:hypothetical protein
VEKLITVTQKGAFVRYTVRGQDWSDAAIEELRRDYGILFRPDGVVPVLIRGSVLQLGIEDDGVLFFGPESPCFHVGYAPSLIRSLQEAILRLTPSGS